MRECVYCGREILESELEDAEYMDDYDSFDGDWICPKCKAPPIGELETDGKSPDS